MMGQKKWEHFERLVTTIHKTKSCGGIVKWNDKINGRQFDVTIRFKAGFYDFLIVIECKNYKNKVPVEKVEAFITKAKDINANKAIMVSSHGYQKSCMDIAKHHGIELLILSKGDGIKEEDLEKILIPTLNVYDLRIARSDNKKEILLPKTIGGKLLYYIKKIKIVFPKGPEKKLENVLMRWNPNELNEKERKQEFIFPKGTLAYFPEQEKPIPVYSIRFKYRLIKAKRISDRPALDPFLESEKLSYMILKTPEGDIIHSIKFDKLQLGFDTVIKKDHFYHNPKLNFNYYCENIKDDIVFWILLESYQHGNLIQVKFTQSKKNSNDYVEVKDKKEIERLERLLKNQL
jgi:hypothetical protein